MQHPKTRLSNIKFFSLYLFALLILSSCANRVAPSGGEKDVKPPVLVSSKPANFSTNFRDKEIQINFDEYIQLVELNTQLIVSPLIDPLPEITANKKTVLVKFETPLKENTTYTFNFGSAIADVHEKNVFENFQFVFSTGDFVDSLSLSGNVVYAKSLKPEKGVFVMLYKQNDDSIPYKNKPDYFAKTDEAGNYTINNIGKASYKLFALNDKNSNYIFDQPDEDIAFLKSPVEINDSTKADLKLFNNVPPKLRIRNASLNESGKMSIAFNFRADNISLKSMDLTQNPWQLEEYAANRDTVVLWMSDTTLDSLKIVVYQQEQVIDTAAFILKRKSEGKGIKRSLIVNSTLSGNLLDAGSDLKLMFNHPLSSMDESKIIFMKDSAVTTGVNFMFGDSLKRSIVAKYNWKEEENYELQILPGAFKDIFDLTNDTIKFSFKLKPAAEFGSVNLKLKAEEADMNYIIQLVNDRDEVVREKIITQSSKFLFDFLNPGIYRFKIIYDKNKNNRWDTGDYLKGTQPEEVIYYKENITIRSNWDLDQEWEVPPSGVTSE